MISPVMAWNMVPLPVITGFISSAFILVETKFIPQPISTPTAFGMMTPSAAMTPPIGIPFPWWVSGIRHAHLWINGSCARWRACSRQPSSASSIFSSQIFTGLFICSSFHVNIISFPFSQDSRLFYELFSVVTLSYQYFLKESFKKGCEPGDIRKKWKYNHF